MATTSFQQYKEMGESLGLSGEKLADYVTKQQSILIQLESMEGLEVLVPRIIKMRYPTPIGTGTMMDIAVFV